VKEYKAAIDFGLCAGMCVSKSSTAKVGNTADKCSWDWKAVLAVIPDRRQKGRTKMILLLQASVDTQP
jgi:hypothetical protein